MVRPSNRPDMGSRKGRGMACTPGQMVVPFNKIRNTGGRQGACLMFWERRDYRVFNIGHAKCKLLETEIRFLSCLCSRTCSVVENSTKYLKINLI